jgi:hypothetical protein
VYPKCAEEATNGPYPEPEKSSAHTPHYFPKIHFNITGIHILGI